MTTPHKAASPAARDYRFCDQCEVSLDLHDGEDTCESARMKADLLDRFDRVFGGQGHIDLDSGATA